MIWETFSEIS